jgi:hypothetical protein
MNRQLKYERPKLVELTSNEWNIGFGDSAVACSTGTSPTGLICSRGILPGK